MNKKKKDLPVEPTNEKLVTAVEGMEVPHDLTARQREVLKLRQRGFSQTAIANALGITQPTVHKYLKAIKKKFERDGKSINQNVVVGESLSLYQEVEARAWELYYKAVGSDKPRLGDANKALNLVLTSREKALSMLMDLGLIKRAATEHEHKVVSPLVSEWAKGVAQKKMIVTEVISTQLEELEEPMPPQLKDSFEDAEFIEMDKLEDPTPPEEEE